MNPESNVYRGGRFLNNGIEYARHPYKRMGGPSGNNQIRLDTVENNVPPSALFSIYDGLGDQVTSSDGYSLRHNDMANAAFFDGSARSLPDEEIPSVFYLDADYHSGQPGRGQGDKNRRPTHWYE